MTDSLTSSKSIIIIPCKFGIRYSASEYKKNIVDFIKMLYKIKITLIKLQHLYKRNFENTMFSLYCYLDHFCLILCFVYYYETMTGTAKVWRIILTTYFNNHKIRFIQKHVFHNCGYKVSILVRLWAAEKTLLHGTHQVKKKKIMKMSCLTCLAHYSKYKRIPNSQNNQKNY